MKASCLVWTCALLVACAPQERQVKGIVVDATMNTVTICADGDTLSFSTMDADREKAGGILINDTLEVSYQGTYKQGMSALRLVSYPRQVALLGGDRDEHDCIASAGYVWSEVQKDCIRLFEKGIRVGATDDSDRSVFIVFSPDSTQVELFFSDNLPNEILDRRSLPAGGYAWNVEDDDTKNVCLIEGQWTISQRNKLIYQEVKQ